MPVARLALYGLAAVVFGALPRGHASAQENIALTGLAAQSSTDSTDDVERPAAAAIDARSRTFSATAKSDDRARWEVELGVDARIERILLHNRRDCCRARLRDVTVAIYDLSFVDDPLGLEEPLFRTLPLNPNNVLGDPAELEVIVAPPVAGRFVRVTRTSDPRVEDDLERNQLALAELEVFGTRLPECPEPGSPDDADTHCNGLSIDGLPGNLPGLFAISASARDETGDEILYTFTAENGVTPPLVVGPVARETIGMRLATGDWTIRAIADDDRYCDDEAADASCEIAIRVADSGSINRAEFRPTFQSSDAAPGSFESDRAADGELESFSQTDIDDTAPFLELDLLSDVAIHFVVLHAPDEHRSRLRDITVTIRDAGGATMFRSALLNPENALGGGTLDGPALIVVPIADLAGAPLLGRRLRVTRTPDLDLSGTGGLGDEAEATVLAIAELEVYDFDCTRKGAAACDGISVDGPSDEGPGLYRVSTSVFGAPNLNVYHTFVATERRGTTFVLGPQRSNFANFDLEVGEWEIEVRIGDSPACVNTGPGSVCGTTTVVRVLGDGFNVARRGSVLQSSDANPESTADLAIDGDRSTFTHTDARDDQAEWEINFGAPYALNSIVLHNRLDCCMSRLRDIEVELLDALRRPVWVSDILNPDNESWARTLFGPERIHLPLREIRGEDQIAQYVIVRRYADPDLSGTQGQGGLAEQNVLSLAEFEAFSIFVPPDEVFVRGDADGSGVINLSDAVRILSWSFQGAAAPECLDAADADDSGQINLTDPVVILLWLFQGGAAPLDPAPSGTAYVGLDCGVDPTSADSLRCVSPGEVCGG